MSGNFDVFISHPGTFKPLAKDLRECLRYKNIRTFVDHEDLHLGDIASEVMNKALRTAKVVLVLIDSYYYINSEYCMNELRTALDRKDCIVLPLFFSAMDEYEAYIDQNKSHLRKTGQNWKTPWDFRKIRRTIEEITGRTGICVKESKSFETGKIVFYVIKRLESGNEPLSKNLHDDDEINAQFKIMTEEFALKKRMEMRIALHSSLWRAGMPIRECKPPPLETQKNVNLHGEIFERIKASLLREATSTFTGTGNTSIITGVRAAGGVGKTWLAMRIAHDDEIKLYFIDGILWFTFGDILNIAKALNKIFSDLGSTKDLDVEGAANFLANLFKNVNPKILLILDDIWHEEHLKIFKKLLSNQSNIKVIITTRLEEPIRKVFGKSTIETLNPQLEENEGFELMEKYANTGKSEIKRDEESMRRIGGMLHYHPKALSIVATQAYKHGTWAKYATALERSNEDSDWCIETMDEAKRAVVVAIEKVLAFIQAKRQHENLREKFSRLGIFLEDQRFSKEDIRIAWGEMKGSEKMELVNTFMECSILEKGRDPIKITDPVYYMHDLVREHAENICKKSNYKKKYIVEIERICLKSKKDITTYLFENIGSHLKEKEHDALVKEVENAYARAKGGHVTPIYGENEVLWDIILKNNTTYSIKMTGRRQFEAFCNALKYNERTSILKGSAITDAGMGHLGQALEENKTLEEVNLWKNSITGPGVQAFIRGRESALSLTNLNFSCNKVRNLGAKVLGKYLEKNHCLLELNLRENCIEDAGIKELAKGLKKNHTLLRLDLDDNKFKSDGAIALGEALIQNNSLVFLSVSDNLLGAQGAQAFGKALEKNDSLKTLVLRETGLGDKGAKILVKSLEKNSTLQALGVQDNDLSDKSKKRLQNVWLKHYDYRQGSESLFL